MSRIAEPLARLSVRARATVFCLVLTLTATLTLTAPAVEMGGFDIDATGATTKWDGNSLVLIYTNPANYTLTLPSYADAWVLAVGGGGAGANPGEAKTTQGGAGGGGAGGFVENKSLRLKNGIYEITVGAGGTSPDAQGAGGNGGDTSFTLGGANVVDVAIGGGGGGIMATKGGAGGSGGGGSNGGEPGSGTSGQGNDGGKATVNRSGAGGGGAGGIGGSTASNAHGGDGGLGRYSSITGDEIMYAAGGGGGSRTGTGGIGGTNSVGTVIGGSGGGGTSTAVVKPGKGTDGTGSGGGGGAYNSQVGGAGGSGTVIVRLNRIMPSIPTNAVYSYTGAEITAYTADENACTVTGDAAGTDVRDYEYTVTLKSGAVWSDGSSSPHSKTVTWSIYLPPLVIESFTMEDWVPGGAQKTPVITATVNGGPVAQSGLNVSYMYSTASTGPWTSSVPNSSGVWYVRAEIDDTGKVYSAPAEAPVASFTVWANVDDSWRKRLGCATGGGNVRYVANGDGTYDVVHIFTSNGTLSVPENVSAVAGSVRLHIVGSASVTLSGTKYTADAEGLTLSPGTAAVTATTGAPAEIRYTVLPNGTKINGAEIWFVGATATNWYDGDLIITYADTNTVGELVLPNYTKAWVLAVGGGGAGANPGDAKTTQGGAGGGGAGGFVETNGVLLANGTYSITVGAGGTSPNAQGAGGKGGDTKFTLGGANAVDVAIGGGGGGIMATKGGDGGSGGGGSNGGGPGSATPGQGNAGGAATVNRSGGGGGGAGGMGGSPASNAQGGAGGLGRYSSITGDEVMYAAGGGGGSRTGTGGVGGTNSVGTVIGGSGAGGSVEAKSGAAGTGSGGGGGSNAFKQGGAGGSGILIIRISPDGVMPVKPEPPVPSEFPYDGEEHVMVEPSAAYTIDGDAAGTAVNNYTYTVRLNEGFCWADGSDGDAGPFTWKITKATIAVKEFSQRGWQIGEERPAPVLTATNTVTGAEVTLAESGVTYTYSSSPSSGFTTIVPSTAGTWYMRAAVAESANNTGFTTDVISFDLWEASATPGAYSGILAFHADFTVEGYDAPPRTTLENFPMLVRVSEDSPYGFSYATADPETIRFVDEVGTSLPFRRESWNPGGESRFWVIIPEYRRGAKVTMCWGLVADAELPPEGEWTDPTGTSEDWQYAEGIQEGDPDPNPPSSNAIYDGSSKVENFWIVEPTGSPTAWSTGEEVNVPDFGTPVYGAGTAFYIMSTISGEIVSETNSTKVASAGTYWLNIVVPEGHTSGNFSWKSLSYHVVVIVSAHTPISGLGGSTGSSTLSGRVLLANDDDNTAAPVSGQGYYLDNPGVGDAYWVHDEEGKSSVSKAFPNLEEHVSHTLVSSAPIAELCGETNIWRLVDVRIGNTYTSVAEISNPDKAKNFLPYSETSKPFTAPSEQHGVPKESAHLVMRNMTGAVIYSPCYTNGIGTIYFDAVNGWNTNAWKTTALTSEALANYHQIVVEVVRGVTTNIADIAESDWEKVNVVSLKRDGTESFVHDGTTNTLGLCIGNGGTLNNFYRLVVPFDGVTNGECREPVRFRIRRVTSVPTDTFKIDEAAFILIDNLIVSYPAMRADLRSAGRFDESKTGRSVLGEECAFSVPYPAAGQTGVTPRALASFTTNALAQANIDEFITAANIHYRWRYLEQKTNDAWKVASLDPKTITAEVPLLGSADVMDLSSDDGRARQGDIEFWFDATLNAPFYRYVDYSGSGLGVEWTDASDTRHTYSEEILSVTNAASGRMYASRGTDWFVRLRPGRSPYAALDIVYKRAGSSEVKRERMALDGDGLWRGFVQTRENQTGLLTYRIEALDFCEEPYAEYAATTNYWRCKTDDPLFPVSDALEEGTEESWSTITLDAVTGHVMFQVEDRTNPKAITIVHADYQNFNGWTDAHDRKASDGNGPIFVGTSTTNEYKVGVSPSKQTFREDFSSWQTMPATNEYWKVPTYTDIGHLYGHAAYETFSSDTNGLWGIGQGMWVSKLYRRDANNSGVAIQMEGNGKGYLQFTDPVTAPRGLESVSFNARLGQFVKFDDFAYYYGEPMMSLSNYTFVTRAAFDLNSNNGFSGNASLSMFAYYLPNKGCYEARFEFLGRDTNNPKKSQRICLYRWTVNPSGSKTQTLLGAWTNTNYAVPSVSAASVTNLTTKTANFLPFFISVSNEVNKTWVIAGIRHNQSGNNMRGITLGDALPSTGQSLGIAYCDNDSSKRLTRGTYGVLSANCNGVFGHPQFSKGVIGRNNDVNPGDGQAKVFYQQTYNLSALPDIRDCGARDRFGADTPWNCIPGRMSSWIKDGTDAGQVNAIYSAPAAQELKIFLGTPGRSDWGEAVTNIALTSFGSPTKPFTLPLYTTKDCSVRSEVGGTIEDVRTDIVIDSVELRQFRGGDWDDDKTVNGVSKYLPAWAREENREHVDAHTNFVFTSAWVTNNCVLLSAKRTEIGAPSSIRTPLMDGGGLSRGVGLGMVSVEYANADTNAVLWLQIATNNVSYSTVDSSDHKFDESIWTTVTNYNFAVEPLRSHLARGTLNTYLGLHSVTGVARIVVATNAVAKVANVTDTKKFGEVTITKITCSDEPPVDIHSWWGWNMRTEGDDMDSKGRMYLADFPGSTGDTGLSLSLNESVSADYSKSEIDVSDRESYLPHNPFLQTPTFTSNVVGEVVFKARKFDGSHAEPAAVVLLGSMDASDKDEGTWSRLDGGIFYVTNTYYETYSYKTDPGRNYTAFRLAVMGVEDVKEGESGGGSGLPAGVDGPHRVLIDEMYVSEAVRTRMGFRNVGCFRGDPSLGTSLSSTTEVPGVPSEKMQPLCGESWGVQCEIFGAQLAGDIDFKGHQPRVRLHWYASDVPWGYEKWKDSPSAGSAWLSRATETDEDRYVYRSSMRDSPAAVMSMSTLAPTYVQYMLEVEYYTVGSTKPVTNWMSSADWVVPEWYRPLDLNAQYGGGKNFAAYNILDNVAPGWAWINEVNVFGEFQRLFNTDADCQFVEIAHPPEADISGWTVRLLEPRPSDNAVVTNVLARFGDGGLAGTATPASSEDAAANMVFRVIANKATRQSGKVEAKGGSVDAVWKVDNPTMVFSADGEISAYDPVAFQLVRTSGIVEHEIMLEGTNFMESLEIEAPDYLYRMRDWTTNRLVRSRMILPGYDMGGVDNSLSVTQNFGRCGMEQPTNDWTSGVVMTPGHVNYDQYIDPLHPMPAGEELLVYLTVTGGHIEQSIDGVNFTNGMVSVVVGKNSSVGTNVLYRTDPWYVLSSATTNAGSRRVSIMDLVSDRTATQPYVYTLSGVAKGIGNNVTVNATAGLNPRLATDWGVPEDDPYRDAIVEWLKGGKDLYGNKFEDVTSGEIKLAKFRALSGRVVSDLTLREMYWLDMDPTVGNLALIGGMVSAPGGGPVVDEHCVTWDSGESSIILTNRRVTVYMMITNENDVVKAPAVPRGPNDKTVSWTPYVLRGIVPGEGSQGYNSMMDDWGSVTFKITGMIMNGSESFDNVNAKVPLRHFVFNENSFDSDGYSRIEVRDPYSTLSYGYMSGWWRQWEKDAEAGRPPSGVVYFWTLDTRLPQIGVEMLNKENYYGD